MQEREWEIRVEDARSAKKFLRAMGWGMLMSAIAWAIVWGVILSVVR
jgi:hypothetical protein